MLPNPGLEFESLVRRWLTADGVPGDLPIIIESAPDLTARGGTCRIARVRSAARDPSRTLAILKHAPAGPSFERSARELACLRTIGPELGIRAPRLLGGAADPSTGVTLLLESLEGHHPLMSEGCAPEMARRVLLALAGMHARWRGEADPGKFPFLAVWGTGTAHHPRPHRRRAERYARRLSIFLARYGSSVSEPLTDRLRAIAPRLEGTLNRAALWPRTLIHGDVHLENLMFIVPPDDQIALLDWQSVSAGPALMDAVRFAMESVRLPAGNTGESDLLRDLLRDWAHAAGEPGGANEADARIDDAADITLAGFVSGYAGASPLLPPDPQVTRIFTSMLIPTRSSKAVCSKCRIRRGPPP